MERDHFKQRLAVKNRAGVANWFLSEIRQGATSPRDITARVLNHCLGSRSRWHPALLVAKLIIDHPDEAEQYAEVLMEQEGLSKKDRVAERGRRNRMRKNAPTTAQNRVIQRAGGLSPINRLDAHDQISARLANSALARAAVAFVGDDDD